MGMTVVCFTFQKYPQSQWVDARPHLLSTQPCDQAGLQKRSYHLEGVGQSLSGHVSHKVPVKTTWGLIEPRVKTSSQKLPGAAGPA